MTIAPLYGTLVWCSDMSCLMEDVRGQTVFILWSERRVSGFTLAKETGEPIAYTTVGMAQRNLIFAAMDKADVRWKATGPACPDCLYSTTTRSSILFSLTAARRFVELLPRMFTNDRTPWKSGKPTRDVFFDIVDVLLEEMNEYEGDTVLVLDDGLLCEHPRLGKKRRKRAK